jgi:hypothetical protein
MIADQRLRTAADPHGSRRLIASDQGKGAFVYAPDGNRLGRIERVMVDAATGEVVHAVVNFASKSHMGITADQHPVPWSLLAYNSRFGGYELRITDGKSFIER